MALEPWENKQSSYPVTGTIATRDLNSPSYEDSKMQAYNSSMNQKPSYTELESALLHALAAAQLKLTNDEVTHLILSLLTAVTSKLKETLSRRTEVSSRPYYSATPELSSGLSSSGTISTEAQASAILSGLSRSAVTLVSDFCRANGVRFQVNAAK